MSSEEARHEHHDLSDSSDLELDAVPFSDDSLTVPGLQQDAVQESLNEPALASSTRTDQTHSDLDDCLTKTPVEIKYDVCILCHHRCHHIANTLRHKLQTLSFNPDRRLNVTLSGEFGKGGATDIANLDDLLLKVPCIFLIIEETFFTDRQCLFEANVAMSYSLTNEFSLIKNSVIPIFMKKKREINGMTPSMAAMTGINYYEEEWNDETKTAFQNNIQRCLDKALRKQMEDDLKNLHT